MDGGELEGDLLESPFPSTGIVQSHEKRFVALSFRSSSSQGAKQFYKVESTGH